jgi:hypothetical protein
MKMPTKEPVKKAATVVKKPEKLSDKDLRELMNVDKPVYKKSRGAWRNA